MHHSRATCTVPENNDARGSTILCNRCCSKTFVLNHLSSREISLVGHRAFSLFSINLNHTPYWCFAVSSILTTSPLSLVFSRPYFHGASNAALKDDTEPMSQKNNSPASAPDNDECGRMPLSRCVTLPLPLPVALFRTLDEITRSHNLRYGGTPTLDPSGTPLQTRTFLSFNTTHPDLVSYPAPPTRDRPLITSATSPPSNYRHPSPRRLLPLGSRICLRSAPAIGKREHIQLGECDCSW